MRDIVSFAQFKKRQKQLKKSFTFSKVAGYLHGYYSRFLNCTNGAKLRKASHIHALGREEVIAMGTERIKNKKSKKEGPATSLGMALSKSVLITEKRTIWYLIAEY